MLSTLGFFLESLRAISTQVCGRPSIAIQLSLTRVWSCLFLVSDDAYAVMEPLLLSPQLSPSSSSSFTSLLNVFSFSTVFLLLFLIPCATPFCPLACECNEEVLSVSCAASQLEVESSQNSNSKTMSQVLPITLNPGIQRLQLQRNNIRAVDAALGFYAQLQ